MSQSVRAIYRDGSLELQGPVDLIEGELVYIEIRPLENSVTTHPNDMSPSSKGHEIEDGTPDTTSSNNMTEGRGDDA